jgi:hypothetical protein
LDNTAPRQFLGEKHIAMVSSQSTRNPMIEWCEFEERPGPPPATAGHSGATIYLTREDFGPGNDSTSLS